MARLELSLQKLRVLVDTSLTTLLPHSDQADETILEASLDPYHLLLHLTTGPPLDKVVTSGVGEGLRARHSLEARWDPQRRSRSAAILLELMRLDLTGDLVSNLWKSTSEPC